MNILSTVATFALIPLLGLHAPSKSINIDLRRQTNSPSQERDAQIWGDKIVYTNFGGAQDIDVWQKDLSGVSSPLLEKPGQQWAGDLYGELLAYTDYQYETGVYQVWIYNLKTNQDKQITYGERSSGSPVLTEKYLYYIDGYDCGSLVQYDLKRSVSRVIDTNACMPKASNHFVVWYAGADGSSNVYGYNTHRNYKFTIADGASSQDQPSISGSTVVWYETGVGGNSIRLKNLRSGKSQTLTSSPSDTYSYPSISEDYVVWGHSSSPGVAGVEGYSRRLKRTFEVQVQGPHQNSNLATDIYENKAAWQAWRTGNGDIYSAEFALR